jgi:hypothetical protein
MIIAPARQAGLLHQYLARLCDQDGGWPTLSKIQKTAEDYMYKRKLLEYKSLHSSILSSIKTTMFEKSNETEAHASAWPTFAKAWPQSWPVRG